MLLVTYRVSTHRRPPFLALALRSAQLAARCRFVTSLARPGSGEETFHVNWSGFQVGSDAKTTLDIDLFVEAGVNG